MSDSDSISRVRDGQLRSRPMLWLPFLENEGVEARVLGEALQGAFGGIEAGTLDRSRCGSPPPIAPRRSR